MENRENLFTALACVVISVAYFASLAWNAVEALMGSAKFAYWHWVSFFPMMLFFTLTQLHENPEAVAILKRLYMRTRKWLHYHSRTISRAIAAVALFIFRPYNNNKPQTEP